MIDLNLKKRSQLADSKESYENNSDYEKALRFASPELQNELKGYAQSVREKHGEEIYNNALKLMESKKLADYQQALALFESISKWKDVKANIEECKANIDNLQKAAAKSKRTKLIAMIMVVVFLFSLFLFQNLYIHLIYLMQYMRSRMSFRYHF